MRRFYSTLLVVAMAFSAAAVSQFSLRHLSMSPYLAAMNDGVITCADDFAEQLANKVASIGSRATATDVVAGDYQMIIGDFYFEDGKLGYDTISCRIAVDGDAATLSSDHFPVDVVGSFNSGTNTITFDSMRLGQFQFEGGEMYYVAFEPFKYIMDNSTGKGSVVARSFSISYADGSFKCPANQGFSWKVYSDELYVNSIGYIDMFDLVVLAKKNSEEPGTDPDEGWTTLGGKALLADPWLLPRYGYNAMTEEQYRYEVTVQQNDENKNIYRLVDPYKGVSPVASLNSSTTPGYIQFDVTDPEHVIFAAVDAGFVNNEPFSYFDNGIEKLYCLNRLSYFAGMYNWPPTQIIQMLGASCPYTTYKDGVVSLSGNDSYDDAIVGLNNKPFGGFKWTLEGTNAVMKGFIRMPADITAIDAVESDAGLPVRYFNLQGIEVSVPSAGEVVIRLQGSRADKIIVR